MRVFITTILLLFSAACFSQCDCEEVDRSHCKSNGRLTDEFLYFVDFHSAQVGDITVDLQDFVDACASSGRSGYIHQGEFTITEQIELIGVSIDLEFDRNCIIKSTAAMTEAMFLFRQSDVRIEGGQFDARLSPFGLNVQSVTALSFVSCTDITITESKFYGISANRPTDPNQFGDSGITTVDCYDMSITNCYFEGLPDLGIYISGNNNSDRSDDGGSIYIADNYFKDCSSAISMKRQATNATITGNRVLNAFVGMSCFPSGGNELAGDKNIFTGNHLINCERGIEVRGGEGFVIISNNYFENNIEMAVRLWGAKDCVVTSNAMNGGKTGVQLNDWTTFIPTGNLVSNNVIKGYTNAVNELNGSGENYYSYNVYDGLFGITNANSKVLQF